MSEYHAFTPDGIKHFEIYRATGPHTRLSRWRLARVAPGSCGGAEGFPTVASAKRWAAKLNPHVTWRKATPEAK
jgi:hypothetical protein